MGVSYQQIANDQAFRHYLAESEDDIDAQHMLGVLTDIAFDVADWLEKTADVLQGHAEMKDANDARYYAGLLTGPLDGPR